MATTNTQLPEGFEAMGHPVPLFRRENAYRALRDDMVPDASVEECQSLVERMAKHIEDDQPYRAQREATDAPITPPQRDPTNPVSTRYDGQPGLRLDYTGALRLFATLLTCQEEVGSARGGPNEIDAPLVSRGPDGTAVISFPDQSEEES